MMTRSRYLLAAIVVLLLATWLRFHDLDLQSFWHDEGNSARLSERSLRLIVEGTASDIHPPLYYIILRLWQDLVGASEFTLRAVSAFAGLLLIAMTLVLARFTVRASMAQRVGIIAAFLVAINPAMLWYSQEARMYTMLPLWVILATLFLLKALATGWTGRLSAGYVLTLAAGFYTHYFFPITLVIHGFVVLVAHFSGERKLLWSWMQRTGVGLLLFLPWLPFVLSGVGGNRGVPRPLILFLEEVSGWLWFGFGMQSFPLVWLLWMVAILGLILFRQHPPISLIALIIFPPVALAIINATDTSFNKFVLMLIPALAILVAESIAYLAKYPRSGTKPGRNLAIFALFFMGWVSWESWERANRDFARDDYRGIAALISAENDPSTAVLLNAPNQWEVFTWYHREGATVYPLKTDSYLQTADDLTTITAQHKRLYTLYWGDSLQDPEHWVEEWLDDNTFKVTEAWYGQVRLVQYAVPRGASNIMQNPLNLTFGDEMLLEGYTLQSNTLLPGDILELTLFWQLKSSSEGRYKLFVHLLNEDGSLVAQRDLEPVPYTFDWTPGDTRILTPGMLLPADTPTGTYRLSIGLYDALDPSARLLLPDGRDNLVIETIEVVAP